MDWETSKENYKPLRTGRDPTTVLEEHKPLSINDKKETIEEQRRAYWEKVTTYDGPDPLDQWLRFIKWTQDTFASGGLQAQLLPLLERATRELQHIERYHQDPRYLRIWIQYADQLPDPREVFLFLKQNEIGTDYALYYIAYASYLELRGSFSKADAVYLEGINRLAKPVDRLKQKHVEFQQRMARRIERKAQQGADDVHADSSAVRSSLGRIKSQKSTTIPGAPSNNQTARQNNSALEVYEDEDVSSSSVQPWPSKPAEPSSWTKFGSFESNRKENVQKAATWAGARLRQKKEQAPVHAPELEVYEDEELQENGTQQLQAVNAPTATLRQRLDGDIQPLGWQKDPLAMHKESYLKPRGPTATAPEPPSNPPRPLELAWDNATLIDSDGSELTFEELRARAWLTCHQSTCGTSAVPQQYVYGSILSPVQEQYSAECSQDSAGLCTAPDKDPEHVQSNTRKGMPLSTHCVEAPQHEQPADGPLGGPVSVSAVSNPDQQYDVGFPGDGNPVTCEEMTLDENGQPMMVQPKRPQSMSQSQLQDLMSTHAQLGALSFCEDVSSGLDCYPEPTVTINTREALSAVNNMFSSALPHEHHHIPTAAADPTVTISTMDAFNAINKLFQSHLPHEGQHHRESAASSGVGPAAVCDSGHADAYSSGLSPLKGTELEVYEDTQFLMQTNGSGTTTRLEVYEDTQCLSPYRQRDGAVNLQAGRDVLQDDSLEVYEDTALLNATEHHDDGGGLLQHNNTQNRMSCVEGMPMMDKTVPPAHSLGDKENMSCGSALIGNKVLASTRQAAAAADQDLQPFEDDDL